jgi:DNA repair exonuclease SbcCD nuclease subunit
MKIYHISDLHWSTQQLLKCLESSKQIESIAKENKPDLILVTGDLQNNILTVEEETAYAPMMQHIQTLANIAPVVIIYGNDNHDAPKSLEPLKLLKTEFPIYVSDYPETIWLNNTQGLIRFDPVINQSNSSCRTIATIHTLPYPTKEFLLRDKQEGQQIDSLNELALQNLRMIFLGMNTGNIEGVPTILMFHANVANTKSSNGQIVSTHAKDIFIPKYDLESSGADYIAGGHIHLYQMFSEKGGYVGSTYHVNFGETEKKYVNFVEVEVGKLPKIHAVELTATHSMVKHTAQFIDGQVIPSIDEPADDWQNAELRVIVTMDEEQRKTYDEEIVKKYYSGAFSYKIEPETIYVERARSETIGQAITLTDQFNSWAEAIDKKDKVDESVIEELQSIELEYTKKNG